MSVGFVGLLSVVVIGGLALLVPTQELAAANATSPAGQALLHRFISRSRRFRLFGGLAGITVSIVITATRTDASFTIGLLPALAGAVAGSILAEAFRIRSANGPRTASLGVRQDIDYSDPTADSRERILGGVTVTLTVLAFAQQNWSAASLFLVVVGASLLRRWAQHRVVMRGRPAMEPDLTKADDQVRRMAVRHGLARPMVTLMALLVSSQAAILGSAYEDPSLPRQAAGLISLALAIAGVVWWWTNRNFGAPSVNRARGRAAAVFALAALGLFALMFATRALL
jgi:hypothetical protein